MTSESNSPPKCELPGFKAKNIFHFVILAALVFFVDNVFFILKVLGSHIFFETEIKKLKNKKQNNLNQTYNIVKVKTEYMTWT